MKVKQPKKRFSNIILDKKLVKTKLIINPEFVIRFEEWLEFKLEMPETIYKMNLYLILYKILIPLFIWRNI